MRFRVLAARCGAGLAKATATRLYRLTISRNKADQICGKVLTDNKNYVFAMAHDFLCPSGHQTPDLVVNSLLRESGPQASEAC